MTGPALEPELAAAYVRELSADVTAVVVLDAAGNRLAGPPELAASAAELANDGDGVQHGPDGVTWVARDERHTLVAFAGPEAQPGPTALDLETALNALSGPN
jgi:hypothetical protein